MTRCWPPWWQEPEGVETDTDGRITRNYMQQSDPPSPPPGPPTVTTTDPWGITDGAVEDHGS